MISNFSSYWTSRTKYYSYFSLMLSLRPKGMQILVTITAIQEHVRKPECACTLCPLFYPFAGSLGLHCCSHGPLLTIFEISQGLRIKRNPSFGFGFNLDFGFCLGICFGFTFGFGFGFVFHFGFDFGLG